MTKFKRELMPGSYLTAADMLAVLSKQHFKAAALQGRIVLAVQPPVAWLLDNCCIGRTAMQSAAPVKVPPGGHGGGSSSDEQLAAAVVGVAGVHAAEPELWQQYIQHQQQVLAQQSRKASRSKRAAAAAAAAAAALQAARAAEVQGEGGGNELVCLVQLSFQEAVFLSHVLRCCSVMSADDHLSQDQQQDRSNGIQAAAAAATGHTQAQQAGHNSSSSGYTSLQQGQEGSAGVPGQPPQQQSKGRAAAATPAATLLSGSELWQWCCQHTTGGAQVFAPQYAAYHHLRSLGWLPLPGLAYGADYVLYQLHPELAHSDFVVTVMVEGDARQAGAPEQVQQASSSAAATVGQPGVEPGVQQRPQQLPEGVQQTPAALPSTQLAWLDACIMQRLARQVLKEMMLLYVVVPPGTSLLHFDCIDSFQVRELFLQRWVPSEHRDSGK